MSEDEIDNLIDFLAVNPTAGVEIAGTGGCRKVRLAGRGKGKSGGSSGFKVGRDAKSGQFVPVKEAQRRPATTVVETIKPKPKGK